VGRKPMIDIRTATVAACGVSAGLHGALFAVHAGELPRHAAAFLTAALLLSGVGLVVALRPAAREGPALAAALFAALLVAYPLARHEPFDAVAAIAKAVEGVGLVLSLRLLRVASSTAEPGTFVVFAICGAAGIMLGGGHGH
jgi:hypothetical protein